MLTRIGRLSAAHGGVINPTPITVVIPPQTDKPDAITDLSAQSAGTNQITLSWSAPADNNAAITDYVVEYKESASSTFLTFTDGVSTATGATITGLLENTSYDMRVAAINSEGQGDYSNVASATTDVSAPVIPFTHDTDTYWIDFTSASNTSETTGYSSTATAIEQIVGTANLVQPTKDFQPLNQTDGVNFNKDTVRQMQVENPAGITNGSNGWYIAVNCRVDSADSNILSIARNVSSAASRGQIYIPSNRQFGFKAANNDGSAPNWICRGPAITLGQWYTLEMQWDLASDTVTIWYDGVEQTNAISTAALAMSAFPATDPSEMTVGNWSASDGDSFDGDIQNLIFHDNVPSTAIRSSISTYLTGVRP